MAPLHKTGFKGRSTRELETVESLINFCDYEKLQATKCYIAGKRISKKHVILYKKNIYLTKEAFGESKALYDLEMIYEVNMKKQPSIFVAGSDLLMLKVQNNLQTKDLVIQLYTMDFVNLYQAYKK